MKDGRIMSIEYLMAVTDAQSVVEAMEIFEAKRSLAKYDGFEVWAGSRHVYRYPADPI
jgi:hypothetical protein